MSGTDGTMVPEVANSSRSDVPGIRPRGVPWIRILLACVLLAGSGAVRWRQSLAIDARLRDGQKPPFPLEELPLTLGAWRGASATLDPKIVQATGAVDLITRHYVDQRTGAAVNLILMYGPPGEMYNHTPDVCYPAAGFELVDANDNRVVKAGTIESPFRALVFSKGEGGQNARQEVYHSWRSDGRWSLGVGLQKHYERIPGIFKIAISRQVAENERRSIGNPCEGFLEVLLPELERRLTASLSTSAPSGTGPR